MLLIASCVLWGLRLLLRLQRLLLGCDTCAERDDRVPSSLFLYFHLDDGSNESSLFLAAVRMRRFKSHAGQTTSVWLASLNVFSPGPYNISISRNIRVPWTPASSGISRVPCTTPNHAIGRGLPRCELEVSSLRSHTATWLYLVNVLLHVLRLKVYLFKIIEEYLKNTLTYTVVHIGIAILKKKKQLIAFYTGFAV